ncbi:sugar ABC transporter ATP-binding protein [Sulfitobacter sp. D35]|uniref:sugar ABC transporter ATP-binding protein n=1 Tax=Sulfitobacter sp. D35 TaxID=3083252 RepID=UPI00296E657B|nr:sugar ABC transporter ATP-binding protein [Sulfitobacter sp. D35]MDW4499357.1 sugar ABC transporter ATP-binding protein [Sulfitobacter sp. D35]
MAPPFLKTEGLTKHFGPVRALTDVSIEARAGEILALVGENGAGKSTLTRLLEGVFPPTRGTIHVEGAEARFAQPREAHQAGIRVIHQEPEIVPDLSVAENIFTGDLPRRGRFFLDWSRLQAGTQALLETFGMTGELHPRQLCSGLGPAQRQMIEIMRAVQAGGRLIAFDEPTSSLTDEETRRLFKLIRRLRDEGVAIIYISHRLAEITELADRIAVLRDGELVEDLPAEGVTEQEITRYMVGRPLSDLFPQRQPEMGDVVLSVQDMSTEHVDDISFDLRAGEVLGIGGLIGAGRSELAKGVFGFHRRTGGSVSLAGVELPSGDTGAAIAAGLGFAPEDRKDEALLLLQTILENAVLCVPEKVSKAGFFSRGRALDLIGGISGQMRLKASSLDAPVTSLSGGNQQKVVLTRWLACDLKVLILDEPTRGIDVGARSEIYDLIRKLTDRNGLGVIVISSEMPELLGLSDRILVMADGRIRAELDRAEANEEAIMAAAIPQGRAAPQRELEGVGR